jgi:hypothetical protein
MRRKIRVEAAESAAIGLFLASASECRTAEDRREFGRGFIHGALGVPYDAGFGLEHTLTVCVPLGPYRRGYLAGIAACRPAN